MFLINMEIMLNLWSFSELGQINVCYVYNKIPNVSATDSPLFHSLAMVITTGMHAHSNCNQ